MFPSLEVQPSACPLLILRPIVEKKLGMKRQKKMSSALLNLTRSVQELTEENQSLKEDLDRMLSNSPTISKIKGICRQATHRGRHKETGHVLFYGER